MTVNFIKDKKQIHMIGIGGSGMYPLAQILHNLSYNITGSDNNETETLNAVMNMGIKVFLGHNSANIEGADLIIKSAAIMDTNPEIIAAKMNGIEIRERSELLGLITAWYKNAVCVSGTHGKTTTTSMLTHLFLADGEDISAFIGGKLPIIGGSGKLGTSSTIVCEACEFNNTFLDMHPNISLILNIDEDHMDFFKTMENLRDSFTKFINKTTDTIVVNGDDENTMIAVQNSDFKGKIVTFGWSDKNEYYPANVKRIDNFRTDFTLMQNGLKLINLSIYVSGEHNVLNAVAAAATAISSGCKASSLKLGFSEFKGVGRRFEVLYNNFGITVIDDYAHHPAEIKATLKTAKSMDFKRVFAVHQPFTYSRTSILMNEFAEALRIADKVILTEIMGSREVNIYGVSSQELAEKVGTNSVYESFEAVADYLAKYLQPGDMAITLGCGDVYKIAKMTVERLIQMEPDRLKRLEEKVAEEDNIDD